MRTVWFSISLALTALAAFALTALAAVDQDNFDAGKQSSVRGRITEIQTDAGQFTLITSDGKELKLHVDIESRLRLNDQVADLGRFKKGDRVRVTYEAGPGKNRVVSMTEIPTTADEVARHVREALRAAKDYTFQQKDEYAKRLESLLRDLDDRIDDVREQAKEAGAAARREYAQELKELREKREVVREKLAKVRSSSAEAWEDIKAGVGEAMKDLQKAYERARSRFK